MKLSKDLTETLNRAISEAIERRHDFVTLEHLLYSLTFNSEILDILQNLGGDVLELREELERFMEEDLQSIVKTEGDVNPRYTVGVQFVLQFAAFHVQSAGKSEVKASNVLIAMYREEESQAVFLLQSQDIRRNDVIRYVSHGIPKIASFNPEEDLYSGSEDIASENSDPSEESESAQAKIFHRFCTNLVELARLGKLDPCIGRNEEIQRTIHILARRRKNNPVFVGDAGVGKTAIVEGLSLLIAQGKVPEKISHLEIYSLDLGLLIAGTKFRGDFEERLKLIVDYASKHKNIVLFIDEIHNIVGAGSVSGGSMDASNLLKPALSNGSIRVIGTTTFREYKSIFEKDHALTRRFQKIDVAEPSREDTIAILKGLQNQYAQYHGVSYSSGAIVQAVDLSIRHILDKKLPDKAIDLIDEAGAYVKLKATSSAPPRVKSADIEMIVSRIAKVPIANLKQSEKKKIQDLEPTLRARIYGQEEAIRQVNEAILYSMAGLADGNKPIASFLFVGPTGVGKTELAKTIADVLNVALLRYDMSEYRERHSISRLIGSPPGYVGHGETALLTDEVRKNPHSVILIDEIEKAHEDIFNLFLQIMDYGTLTDSMGRKADFRKTILILTTNTGASEKSKSLLGFGERDSEDDRDVKAVERTFPPEFRNRLTSIILFSSLPMEIVEKIVEREIQNLIYRIRDKSINLMITERAKKELAVKGYDPKMGARPIQRLIDEKVGKPLAKMILFGNLKTGDTIQIDLNEEISEFSLRKL